MALVSAHRAAEAGLDALAAVAASGVDHVELDVRCTRDGVPVVAHDAVVGPRGRRVALAGVDARDLPAEAGRVLTLAQCLEVVRGRAGAHVDLKAAAPSAAPTGSGALDRRDLEAAWEVRVARAVLDALGEDGAVFTSDDDACVARLRAWAELTGRTGLRVGLSLGQGVAGLGPARAVARLRSELFPARRVAGCGANLLVAQKDLARAALARWARRHQVPLLVWTVDSDRELEHWLAPGRAWMVTTDRPERALQIAATTSRPR